MKITNSKPRKLINKTVVGSGRLSNFLFFYRKFPLINLEGIFLTLSEASLRFMNVNATGRPLDCGMHLF